MPIAEIPKIVPGSGTGFGVKLTYTEYVLSELRSKLVLNVPPLRLFWKFCVSTFTMFGSQVYVLGSIAVPPD